MKNDLHILQLPSWYLPYGGQFVTQQTQILQEKGLTVNVLANIETSLSYNKWKYFTFPLKSKFTEEDGFTVYRNFFRAIPKFGKINVELYARKTLRMFEKYCKKFGKPDIIHVHSAIWAGVAALKIKEKYGVPYVITEHRGRFGQSCNYAENLFKNWQTPLLQIAFSNADAIIPVSENLIPKISSFLIKEVPFSPISNVIDTVFFHYKPRENSEKIRFITTNSFDRAKAYDILLPAFDNACEQISNLELTIAGGKFFGNQDFEKIWQTIKNQDNFRFVGFLSPEQVRNELWQANIFVLASRIESQSISTLEALSTGLPAICTEVVPKIIATTENSTVVPVEDTEVLTNAIVEMAKNYKTYDNKKISENVKMICGKEAVAEKIIEVYKSILK